MPPYIPDTHSDLVGHVDSSKFVEAITGDQVIRLVGWIAHRFLPITQLNLVLPRGEQFKSTKLLRLDVSQKLPQFTPERIWGYSFDIPLDAEQKDPTIMLKLSVTLADYSTTQIQMELPRPSAASDGAQTPYGSHAAQQFYRKQCELQFESFLQSKERIIFEPIDEPALSVIIVTHNQAALTFACLQSLLAQARSGFEVIIVDNNSTDATSDLLHRIFGARIERLPENNHFLYAANHGAVIARGANLLFLNNDLILLPGSINALLNIIRQEPRLGAVGGKLIRPDGLLQEAGSSIHSDGTTTGIGRGKQPFTPEFCVRTEVDYCSGALLLTPRQLFLDMGLFHKQFAPAYYEDVDYCVRLQEYGYKVLYEPVAAAIHLHHGSDPSHEDALRLMKKNRERFKQHHLTYLAKKTAHKTSAPHAEYKTVLIIDDFYPATTKGQGQPRTIRLLESLARQDAAVYFFASRETHQPATPFMASVTPLYPSRQALLTWIAEHAHTLSHIIVSRPTNMEWFIELQDHITQQNKHIRIIYDAEAVFAVRDMGLQHIKHAVTFSDEEQQNIIDIELSLARRADCILTVSELDMSHFFRAGFTSIEKLSYVTYPTSARAPWQLRRGLLTIGPMLDAESPNTDAACWIENELLPELPTAIVHAGMTHIGAVDPVIAARFKQDTFRFMGVVADIESAYNRARVFLAPTRFGSGIPLKVIEAAASGLPCVITSLLASQLRWTHERECLVADTPKDFARETARLHDDEALWLGIQERALARVTTEYSEATFDATLKQILSM